MGTSSSIIGGSKCSISSICSTSVSKSSTLSIHSGLLINLFTFFLLTSILPPDVFSVFKIFAEVPHGEDIGVQHEINLFPGSRPVAEGLRRYSPDQSKFI